MKQITKIIVGIVIAVIVIWAGVRLFSQPSTPASIEPIKIGFIGPLTGDVASIGTVDKVAMEVAVDEINKAGGINGRKLEAVYEDGNCNAKIATNAASKLINIDKVVAINGGLCSTETSAFGPMAMQNKVITISYGSSAPSLSKLGAYFFRSYPSDTYQGKFGADYAYTTLGARKVAIIYHISDAGTGIKEVFQQRFMELGGTVVTVEGALQETRDYRTIMSKIKALNPDLIYMAAYPEGSIAALQQAQDLGIKTKFLGIDAWSDPKLQKEVSGKGEFLFSAPVNPLSEDFKQKILAKTAGDQVPVSVSNAYDNVYLLAQAMRKVGTDPDRLAQALHQMKFEGVSGHIEFDGNGDLITVKYAVSQIKNEGAVEIK